MKWSNESLVTISIQSWVSPPDAGFSKPPENDMSPTTSLNGLVTKSVSSHRGWTSHRPKLWKIDVSVHGVDYLTIAWCESVQMKVVSLQMVQQIGIHWHSQSYENLPTIQSWKALSPCLGKRKNRKKNLQLYGVLLGSRRRRSWKTANQYPRHWNIHFIDITW